MQCSNGYTVPDDLATCQTQLCTALATQTADQLLMIGAGGAILICGIGLLYSLTNKKGHRKRKR